MTSRRALITGASSGIGAASAIELAASDSGYALWLTYTKDEAGARRTVRRCEQLGVEVKLSQLDLRCPASIDSLVTELTRTWQSVHVVVNNGGVCPYQDVEAISVEDWDMVLETNARGMFLLTRALLPALRAVAAGEDRSIVNLSSIAGQIGGVQTSLHYAASKAAILAITRSFARLLAPERIRVNAVSPGPVTSPITDQLDEQRHRDLECGVPLGRFGRPEEVAWIVAALASARASFVTGATYDVNGGVRIT